MMRNIRKNGQQEMVGFVLIVMIVVIGLFVFLLFSLRQTDPKESDIANNILSAMLKTTSRCAIVYEPNYDDMRDLFRSCYDGRRCSNTDELACEVLEESLGDMLDEVMVLEPIITAYQLDFTHENPEGSLPVIPKMVRGSCNGTVYGSEPHTIRIATEESLLINLRICVDSDF